MKPLLLISLSAAFLCACASNPAPQTAWGKEGVSMLDYRTDAGQCAVLAATSNPQGDQRVAGGISGANSSASTNPGDGDRNSASAAGASGTAGTPNSSAGSLPTQTGGIYRDSASPDFVNRAAMQQRSVEMAQQRQRAEALKGCLVERGYKEFPLNAEQRSKLKTLPAGSDERRDYLYKLGTDPQVLKQADRK